VPRYGDGRRMRIGLLGGSFNPAHEGHRHLARTALRRLALDQVWLMVSPGNVLKPVDGMAPFCERLAGARRLGDGRRIVATGIETRIGTRYTLDTMRALARLFPRASFVWIMGADILEQLPRWKHWQELTRLVPFAVFPRPRYNARALAGPAAKMLHDRRLPAGAARLLPTAPAPAWVFLPAPQMLISATAIRAAQNGGSS
jgi:nicotinate-nucleotide adenylyltransferase